MTQLFIINRNTRQENLTCTADPLRISIPLGATDTRIEKVIYSAII